MSDPVDLLDANNTSADRPSECSFSKVDNKEPPDSSIDKDEAKSTILPDPPVTKDNQDNIVADKKQTEDNLDNAEQSNSRELKLLLALSRESNLDTNISRKIKRKTSEHSKKDKEFHYPSTKLKLKHMNLSGKSPKRITEHKSGSYPVTAESELESELGSENEKNETGTENSTKRKREGLTEDNSAGGASEEVYKKIRKSLGNEIIMFKPGKDMFCWRCHREGVNISCETCIRSYHQKCLKQTIVDPEHWPCPECVSILKAESTQSRSEAMKGMTLEHLCSLLKFAADRMIQCQGSEPFIHPVNDKDFPEYKNYIIQPMDLTLLEKNIKDNLYGSPQAFEADAKWILHNSIIFNSFQSKLTYVAKNIIKVCKQEMAEIENCPSCYLNANTKKKTWFTEVCPKPHLIAWAKLKGFPYWPAKIMCYKDDLADVRFFGAHDRAWVPFRDCYLFSIEDPNSFKQKRHDIVQCIDELKVYVENLKKLYGKFKYAPFKTTLDPYNETKQLQIFLPYFGKNDNEIHRKHNAESDPDESEMSNIKKSRSRNSLHSKRMESDSELMEGYGTDDESMTNIDTEKRKKLFGISEKEIEETEPEDEDDTQLLSVTASLLKSAKEKDSDGKAKTSTEAEEETLKTTLEVITVPLDIETRRISEGSVKSDSSRLSNISEKISKVDIAENMEISLRNDEVSCSISENVSSSSESSRSDSDISFELKRKPVQIDIENSEYTILPHNKLKIADKLMKRLSDDGETTNKEISKVSKKDITSESTPEKAIEQTNKSQTDILIEKFKEVVQHKVVDFGNISNESTKSDSNVNIASNLSESIPSNEKMPEANLIEDTANSENDGNSINSKKGAQFETTKTSSKSIEREKKLVIATEKMIQPLETDPKISESSNLKRKFDQVENSTAEIKTSSIKTSNEKIDTTGDTEKGSVYKQVDQNKSRNILEPSESINIIEEILPDEDHDHIFEETHIDQASIMSIIHSSLGVPSTTSKEKEAEVSVSKEKPAMKEANATSHNDKKGTEIRKRRNLDRIDSSPSKVFKLVPAASTHIEKEKLKTSSSVLNQKEPTKQTESNNIVRIASDVSTLNDISPSSSNCLEEIYPVEVKSEPDSEVDTENLEAKKKYLSALQIAEKKDIPEQDVSKNHIRTRARAEEKREKYKNADNLARLTDDIATSYNIPPESKELPVKRVERPKSYLNINKKEGEIFVKSFAKMVPKQRARKSFPMPNYQKIKSIQQQKEAIATIKSIKLHASRPSVSTPTLASNKSPSSSALTKHITVTTVKTTSNVPTVTPSPEVAKNTNGYFVLQSPPNNEFVILPNQQISFPPQPVTQPSSTSKSISSPTNSNPGLTKANQTKYTLDMNCSQNYIPQNEETDTETLSPARNGLSDTIDQTTTAKVTPPPPPSQATAPTPQITNEAPQNQQPAPTTQSAEQESTETQTTDEFGILNSMLHDNVSKTINTMLRRPPPKLKPRPPGMLSTNFADGLPSSAGDVTSRINSVAHRLGDYFRGMLIETLDDLGKSNNPEATVIQLRLELESLKHRHSVELAEIEKNVSTVLRDIQRSIIEDRDKIVDETRAQCEQEAIKRIEEAKSKQWCANCSKEAQFYCCWNTSYCDYPCQQKHWPQHMSKCTQNLNQTPTSAAVHCPTGQPIFLRPAHPPTKQGVGRFVTKPVHKVYMNRNIGNILPKTVKMQGPGQQMTVVETSPGSYQVVSTPVAFRTSNISTVKSTTTQQFAPEKSLIKQKIITPMMPVAAVLDDSD